MNAQPNEMVLDQTKRPESTSREADRARLVVEQFARALEPYLNDIAVGGDSPLQAPGETGVADLTNQGGLPALWDWSDRPASGWAETSRSQTRQASPEGGPESGTAGGSHFQARKWSSEVPPEHLLRQADVAGLQSGPESRSAVVGGDAEAEEAIRSYTIAPGLPGEVVGVEPGDVPPAPSNATHETLRRLRDEGHFLSDSALLFPSFSEAANDISPPVAGERRGNFWDVGSFSSGRRAGWSATSGTSENRPRSSAIGLNSNAEDALGELAFRLLAATKRLEDAAERLVSAASQSLAPPARRFRGRVDG
ncbi:MAG: hypothetical protein ACP5XB_02490 [Isosphaeraceae bacterium]